MDGKSQTREFELFINPGEPYTREQTDERFEFWMDLYNNVEASSQNVLAALKLKAEVNAKVQAMKDSGASKSKLEEAEKQAAVIAGLVDAYESTFVPTGRTLAEIINLPAKIFTKMTWLHNMMEVTEGPVTASQVEVYDRLIGDTDKANAQYRDEIAIAMKKFDSVAN